VNYTNMDDEKKEIRILQDRIAALENENRLLKERLMKAGILYGDIIEGKADDSDVLYEENQGARIHRFDITDKVANDFFMIFCRGRKDVYELRYTNLKTGKTGYYTQCFNRWDRGCHITKKDGVKCKDCEMQAYKPLDLQLIKAHMEGKDPNGNDVVAIYPMLEGNMCQLLVFDFDNHSKGAEQTDHANTDDTWRDEVNALRKICLNLEIDAVVERSRSGQGAHLWIFFKEMIPAKLARRFGFALLEKGAETVNLKSFKYYDRMIPTQDTLPPGGLGNVIALPLQGLALKSGNSAFVDENWNAYPDQLKLLAGVKRLTKVEIEDKLAMWQRADEKAINLIEESDNEPWDKNKTFERESVNGIVDIVLSDRIYIDSSNISNGMKRQIRRMATFSNKQYFQNLAMDMPNYDESRYIYLGADDGKYIILPRGLKEELLKGFEQAGIEYKITDRRSDGRKIKVSFRGELRESQKPAVDALLEHETGILHAATAFGKTVVCCEMIARQGVNTLILVDRETLMNQWLERLEQFLDIDEELPEYQTKSGQTRRRKKLIGNLKGAHDSMTGIVDVAMIRSLKKKDGFHPLLKEYGQVILDECQHGASESAAEVLQEISAKYVYGVTATPKRGDGKEKINEFLLGPVRYRYTAKDRAREQNIDHLVYPRFTRTVSPHRLSKTPYGNDAYELIRNNDIRDAQIIKDVQECVEAGRTPVVLTKYVDHANRLAKQLEKYADRLILLTGAVGTKKRRAQAEELNGVSDSESLILVGTGSLLGEGFDFPRLDTLFMATPVSGESVVEQYVGRLNRDYDGKENVIVYDYVDSHVPKFDKMYSARLKAYKKIGYELCAGLDGEKQKANAIYDIDNYSDVYWRDIQEASSEVIVSSPRLNTEKVNRIISTLKSQQETGVKVTIVTWHPDAYKYGRDDVRMALMERLRKSGFEIRFVEESCEHFAIIDREIVWYGSVNLLSKEDVSDNLMRVCSKEIAAELLELTFGKDVDMGEW
jgi:superfamily II DNA or RNA helicase